MLTIQLDRYAKYYKEDGMDKRTLYKVFGIRFDILVNGKVRVARRWVCPWLPRMTVPYPQAGTSSVTQHRGLMGPGKPTRVVSSGQWFCPKKHHNGLGGQLWKVKTFH